MSVNSYLTTLANSAIIRESEKLSIQRSIATLHTRLNNYFDDDVRRHFIFGSYSRGTILPRGMDSRSDIDYMVVFDDSSYRPQTYLDRLRRFVEYYYNRSEIAQSNPTIALSLNHIRFELVPATDDWFYGLRIPANASSYNDWISTNPTDFNDQLVSANQSHSNLIKPLVRLVKYWNAQNGYVYESYELEKMVIGCGFWGNIFLLNTYQLKDYFYDFIESLNLEWNAAQWRKDKVQRAQTITADVKAHERSGYEASAEQKLKKLLPPLNSLIGA